MIIRPATDADGAALAALIARIFAEYPGCRFVDAEFPELKAPASHYRAQGGQLFIAEDAGRLVGSLAATMTRSPGTAELFKVYVAADQRGSGLAQRLFAEGEALVRGAGARTIVLWSDTRFARGHAFYEKLGFARQPVSRYLADASATWEFCFRKALAG
ncbi:GNAT family N-acetyltransferase [Phreatobacter sp. AB_2022a]|uniref:GNAT family N-acetyltransferase n=1 Tax=Phreatobacter sp. AB_2022a TaxID=3003134 RepID=UPI0022870EEC|nr:GNAT family N-acetyltransferase [Phreatobacter sp. AB_2022a]MCZ0737996.1 GNAT family N-acetyltransferase [Phreatobacter sp. AB_2022a]